MSDILGVFASIIGEAASSEVSYWIVAPSIVLSLIGIVLRRL